MDYDADSVDTFEKLKLKFTSFGGLKLEATDEERFFVAYKLFAKKFPDEESLFDELCSHALNGNRVVDTKLLEKLEAEFNPTKIVATPLNEVKKPKPVNTEKRKILNNMSNFSPPKTPRSQQPKQIHKPDSPITLDSTHHNGIYFDDVLDFDSRDLAELVVHDLPKEMFFYGRRFDTFEFSTISVQDQISGQLSSDDDPDKKVTIFGNLLVRKLDNGDEVIELKSGESTVQLDISALNNFSYFHGMSLELSCLPTSSSCLKAVKCVEPKLMPMAPLHGKHEFLRVIVVHGPFIESNAIKPLEVIADKALSISAHAIILCGPFYDPNDTAKFTATSKETFAQLRSKLAGSSIRIIVVPNYMHDQLAMQVFPTPAHTSFDFGISDNDTELSNVSYMTDPCVFDLNGVRFAVTTSQALFFLSKSEKYRGSSQSGDRMSRLCEHILTQRSLCPAQQNQSSSLYHEPYQAHLTERPHFVIVPNTLVPMVKNVQNSVFINARYCNKTTLKYATIAVNLLQARQATGDANIADYSNIAIRSEPLN